MAGPRSCCSRRNPVEAPGTPGVPSQHGKLTGWRVAHYPSRRHDAPCFDLRGRRCRRARGRPHRSCAVDGVGAGGRRQTEAAREIYRQRSEIAETPNLWIKAKLGLRQFCVRGLRKVGMEALWACLAYNIPVWIRLRWRKRLLAFAAGA